MDWDSDNPIKVRVLHTVLGQVEGIEGGIRRGDTIEVPRHAARRMIANGVVSHKHLKTDREELPPGLEVTEETKRFESWSRDEALRQIPEDIRHRVAGTAEYQAPQAVGGYPRGKQFGWIR
jgi:hypothetical protein